MKRINHHGAYSLDGTCTNWAEDYFSRLRRAEICHHHQVVVAYLLRRARESSRGEGHRRLSNSDKDLSKSLLNIYSCEDILPPRTK